MEGQGRREGKKGCDEEARVKRDRAAGTSGKRTSGDGTRGGEGEENFKR